MWRRIRMGTMRPARMAMGIRIAIMDITIERHRGLGCDVEPNGSPMVTSVIVETGSMECTGQRNSMA
jgi:hypothetical protein